TLRSVFDHRYTVSSRDCVNGVHIRTLSVKGNRNNGAGSWSNRRLHFGRVEIVCAGIDVHIYWSGAEQGNCFSSSDISKAWSDYLIPGPDSESHLSDLKGICAVSDGDAMFSSCVIFQPPF